MQHVASETKTGKTKEARFTRLAESRVNAILDKLRLLGQLSNRSNYVYTEGQLDAIFQSLSRELRLTKAKFQSGTRNGRPFVL